MVMLGFFKAGFVGELDNARFAKASTSIELLVLADAIRQSVRNRFDIELEPEPRIVQA